MHIRPCYETILDFINRVCNIIPTSQCHHHTPWHHLLLPFNSFPSFPLLLLPSFACVGILFVSMSGEPMYLVRPCFTASGVSQSVDLGRSNNPNTTPTKDYKNVRVVVYLRGVQRGCAEEGERGSTPTG